MGAGVTVEMHGSVRQLVCPPCGHVVPLTAAAASRLKAREALPCERCGHAPIRTRVMLYDDAEGAASTLSPSSLWVECQQNPTAAGCCTLCSHGRSEKRISFAAETKAA